MAQAQSKAKETQLSAQESVSVDSDASSNIHPPSSNSCSLQPKQVVEEEKPQRKGPRRSRKGSKGAKGDKANEAIRVVKALRVLVNKAHQQQDIFALQRQHIDEAVQPRFDGSPIAPKNLSSQFNSASCISPQPFTLSEGSIERKSSGVIRRSFSESDIPAAMDINPLFTPVRSARRVNPRILSSSADRGEYVTSRRMSDGGIRTAMNTNLLFTPVRPGTTSSTISGNATSNSGGEAAMRTNPLLTPARPTAVPVSVSSDDSAGGGNVMMIGSTDSSGH